MAVGIGVVGVPHGDGHEAQRVLELFEIGGFAHAEPLFEHFGAVESGDAHRDDDAVFVVDHRALDAAADFEAFFLEGAVGLFDFENFGFALEVAELAVEFVLAVAFLEGEEIDGIDGVDGAAPSGARLNPTTGVGNPICGVP